MFDLQEWCELNLQGSVSQSGKEFSARCPFCNRTGKFSVSLTKGVFNCFRGKCSERGRIPKLVSHVEGISYKQACDKVGAAIEVKKSFHSRLPDAKQEDKQVIELPKGYIPCFKAGREPEWRIIKYLKERNIPREILSQFKVGFCKGFPPDEPYFNRVVIPVDSPGVSAFTSRDATTEYQTNERRPKYKNPEGEWASKALLGWEFYERGHDLVLVEGPFDVLRLAAHGIKAISLLGKILNPQQRKVLYSLPASTRITIMIDPEEKRGIIEDIVAQLALKFPNIYVAKLPNGVDPGSCTEEQAYDALDEAQKAV